MGMPGSGLPSDREGPEHHAPGQVRCGNDPDADQYRRGRRTARWSQLRAEHRRWILINALAVSAVINVVVSAALAWLSAAGQARVPQVGWPLVDGPSVLTDTVGTFFLLPFITTLCCTTAIRSYQRRGLLPPLAGDLHTHSLLDRLPSGTIFRGFVLGGTTTAILSAPAIPFVLLLDSAGMSTSYFVAFKAVLGLALGAVITPAVAIYAMTWTEPH